jgi:small subunit ribosomal protein S6
MREGSYVLFTIEASGAVVKEIERRLRVMDQVIKYLTVRLDEDNKRLDKIKAHREKRAARRGRSRAEGGDRRSSHSQAEQMPEE